jgi:hypothetical protein
MRRKHNYVYWQRRLSRLKDAWDGLDQLPVVWVNLLICACFLAAGFVIFPAIYNFFSMIFKYVIPFYQRISR